MTSQRVGRGSSAGCPNFLSEPYSKADYARTVVCFVGLLATAVKLCIFRRRTAAGKKLLGLPYLLALFLFIIAFGLGLIAGTLRECDQISYDDYYKVNIALSVLNGIGFWLLLVVIVWTLNSMLREHLGHRLKASKAVCLAIVVLMGLFSFVVTVLRCYLQWLATTDGLYSGRPVFITEYQYISLVFWVLYLASVLISGVFALLAVRAMRSKQVFGGAFQSWVAALHASVSIWCLISVMLNAKNVTFEMWDIPVMIGLYWISDLCLVLSFVLVIFVAKNRVWARYAEHAFR